MKKTTNELIIEQLLIAQENARNQVYPGYPYQDSIIVDCDNKIAFNHFGYSASEETILYELYAKLLFKVLGDRKATKPTWLNDREIASKEDYCDYNFDSDRLYIDDELATRLYFAIQSAFCEIKDKAIKGAILFAFIDEDCEMIDCKIFTTEQQAKDYLNDSFTEEE